MSEIKGKIEKLDLNFKKPKKDGTTFDTIAIKLEGNDTIQYISHASPAGKWAKDKLNLKIGDEITIEIGGQYNSPQKISKAGGSTFGSAKSSFNKSSFGGSKPAYDGDGAKRGQAMNAAITLLIHNHKDEKITDAHKSELESLARLVFEISTKLEPSKSTVASSKSEQVDPFAKTAATPTASSDFSTNDVTPF